MVKARNISDEIKVIAFKFGHFLKSEESTVEFDDAYALGLLIFNFKGGPARPGKFLSLASAKRMNEVGLVEMSKSFDTTIEYEIPIELRNYYSGTYMKYGTFKDIDWSRPGSWWISASKTSVELAEKFLQNCDFENVVD
jgi:hypothetical protein